MSNLLLDNFIFSGIVTVILCVLLILSKKDKKSSDRYMALWLLLTAVNLVYYLLSGIIPQKIQSFFFTLPTLSICMLYLYTLALTFDLEFKIKYIVKHVAFYFLYNMVFLAISVFYPEINFKNNLPYFTDKNEFLLNLLTIPMAVIPVLYIAFCFRALKKYQEMLPDLYSTLERINLNWLKYILLSLVVLFIIVVGTLSLSTRWNYFSINSTSKIIGAIQAFYLLCIVFFSLRQSIIYDHNTGIKDSKKKKEEVSPLDERSKILSGKLLEYMLIEKPYLDEELNLIKLSSLLDVSTNQLSHVINQNLNTNFYKFINSYRVEEVKQKLKNIEFDHYSILGIAFDSGFSSKSTFNKIFKEETKMTPSQFKNFRP